MKGSLRPEQQLRVLSSVWGTRRGYVFLPWIDGQAKDKNSRRNSYHEGRAFKWPNDKPAILDHLRTHSGDDLYFAPNLFKGKRRVEELVMPERVMYADLDPVDPNDVPEKPTIAWESSPDRFQGIWIMDRENQGSSQASRENHRLTAALKADPSGWDSTQLLRVPGRPNFKFEYAPDDGPNGVEGKGLLWNAGPRYEWEDFADLPKIGSVSDSITTSLDEDVLDNIDRHEVWARIKLKLPHRIRELYLLRHLDPEMDRSAVMWDISRSMADAGANALEITALIRKTVWNKFASRSDEITRLMTQSQRAVANREEPDIVEEEAKPSSITWLSDISAQAIPRPSWLVKNIWTKGSCGFIAGAPKSYKSWMALDMAISVATGSAFLNQPEYKVQAPQPVLYLQEEDDVRLVMDRMANIVEGKVPHRFWHGQITAHGDSLVWEGPKGPPIPLGVHIQTGFIASDDSWQSWLDEVIAEHKFGLIVIDTLGTTAGDIDTDSHGDLMNKLLKPLKVLAQKHNTAVCVVHHNKKAAGLGRAGNDMLGSIALHAWVECAIYARSRDIDGTVAIERESKQAPEVSLKVRIPYMYENHTTGLRQLWDPEIVTPGLGEDEASMEPTERPKSRPTAIVQKLKFMGKKGASLKKLAQVLDQEPQDVLDQLLKAQESGHVREQEGVWSIV